MGTVHDWVQQSWDRYNKKLLLTAFYMTEDSELAADMVQDVFLTLLTKYEEVKDYENIQAWLVKALKCRVQSELQRAHYKRELPLEHGERLPAADPYAPDFSSLMPAGLSENEKEILYLHIEVGLPHEEIAVRLGCSEEACRMRLVRARRKFKKLWREEKKKIF